MTTEKKSNHRANVVRIESIRVHTNADTLELVDIPGTAYQVVAKKGQFKVGDLAVYIQPDSVVPQTKPFKFIWWEYTTCNECGNAGEHKMSCSTGAFSEVPERRRRITVRKFRKEWSEGLLLPVNDFRDPYNPKLEPLDWKEGDDVSDVLGITHYDPDKDAEKSADDSAKPRRRYPRTLKGWFFFLLHRIGFKKAGRQLTEEVSFDLPVYDVEALKNYKNAFTPEDIVVVSEKIHGSNGRFVCIDGKMYAGSHHYWKATNSNCPWRKTLQQNPWIEEWCRKHEGYALYGEIAPTQKGFTYGCTEGQMKFFVFDIRTPEGTWLEWIPSWPETYEMLQGLQIVPILYTGPFDMEKIKEFVDGPSLVDGALKQIREGVVVKAAKNRYVRGLGRLQLKIVSNAFLEKDAK